MDDAEPERVVQVSVSAGLVSVALSCGHAFPCAGFIPEPGARMHCPLCRFDPWAKACVRAASRARSQDALMVRYSAIYDVLVQSGMSSDEAMADVLKRIAER